MVTDALIDIVVYDIARESTTRITTEGSSQYPVWSADGTRLFYRATRTGSRNLFWKAVDGTAAEERLTTNDAVQTPWSIGAGSNVAFVQNTDARNSGIWILPHVGGRTPIPFFHEEQFSEIQPQFSPAGRWLAYVSDRSGKPEVYVTSYPGASDRWQISSGGGRDPMWSRTGRELYYRSGRTIMAVDIAAGVRFVAAAPHLLFESSNVFDEPATDFDPAPDGQRFVMIQPGRTDQPVTHIDVVLNWVEELKQRLPQHPN